MMDSKQRIIFVTGKGGVGKSVVALTLAQKYSAAQKRVLLVELGIRSFYSDFLHLKVQYTPTPYQKNLDIALWSGTECLKEYAIHLLKMESLYKLFFENRISRTLIEIAPGLSELSILGKITSGIRNVGPKLDYDIIVVDSYATGHMMALLRAPRGMNESIRLGPMAEQTASMLATIRNPELSQYLIVSLPEELPAVEASELYADLLKEVGVKPSLFCNKVWPYADIHQFKNFNTPQTPEKERLFIKELEGLTDRQQQWIQYLKERHSEVNLLPMVFSSNPSEIMTTLERNWPI